MADTTEVKLIKSLKLPNTIQGDGRYVLSLLNQYLEQSTKQINLANGFSIEEINPKEGLYVKPNNLVLVSDRNGSRFTWSHLNDLSDFAYYEIRTDTNKGYQNGRLGDKLVVNYTTEVPEDRSGMVYLYAVNKKGEYSNPEVIDYVKEKPPAPTDITISSSSEGTVISFAEIPSDCKGATINVGGATFETKSNSFLYSGVLSSNDVIKIAYIDGFGAGKEASYAMKLPDVTGFLVERNDTQLDFYWDNIDSYGVKYLVKVCQELSWEQGIELFRTATNDKNRRLYPNTGSYYLMVKAYDDSGRFSENAAYQLMANKPSIDRNVILEFNQQQAAYPGTCINVAYNAVLEGVTLDREAQKGEYIFDVKLDQEYRARNWLEYQAISVNNTDIYWQDMNMTWEECQMHWAGVVGDIDSASFKQELATKSSQQSNFLFSASLNGDTDTDTGKQAVESQHCDRFDYGRWATGLTIAPTTRLSYVENLASTFALQFWLKMKTQIPDTVFITLANDNSWLSLGYDRQNEEFFLRSSVGDEARIKHKTREVMEYYFFVISQDETERKLYVYTYNADERLSATTEGRPLGVFNKIYCYPRLSA